MSEAWMGYSNVLTIKYVKTSHPWANRQKQQHSTQLLCSIAIFLSRPSAQSYPQRTAQRLRSRQYTAQTSFQIRAIDFRGMASSWLAEECVGGAWTLVWAQASCVHASPYLAFSCKPRGTAPKILWARIWKLVCAYPPPIHLSPKNRKKIARKPPDKRPKKETFPCYTKFQC